MTERSCGAVMCERQHDPDDNPFHACFVDEQTLLTWRAARDPTAWISSLDAGEVRMVWKDSHGPPPRAPEGDELQALVDLRAQHRGEQGLSSRRPRYESNRAERVLAKMEEDAAALGDRDAEWKKEIGHVGLDHSDWLYHRIPGYERLEYVYLSAYKQAAHGKGHERHANEEPYDQQKICVYNEKLGSIDGAIFQAMKKATEAPRLPRRAAVAELLGAINYLAAAVILLEDYRVPAKEAPEA